MAGAHPKYTEIHPYRLLLRFSTVLIVFNGFSMYLILVGLGLGYYMIMIFYAARERPSAGPPSEILRF